MRSANINNQIQLGALFKRRAMKLSDVLNAQNRPGSLFKRRATD